MGSKIDNLFFDGESIQGINEIYEKCTSHYFYFVKITLLPENTQEFLFINLK